MIREDKELLLQDLCARLPYGVIGEYSWKGNEPYNRELTGGLFDELKSSWNGSEDSEFIPYLRPLSSMTEEEMEEFENFVFPSEEDGNGNYQTGVLEKDIPNYIDWFNKNMFDYRGLIPKGRAIEVTKEELDNLRMQLN